MFRRLQTNRRSRKTHDRNRYRRNEFLRGIEQLEQRLVLSGSPFLDATSVSPQWFETVADLSEYDVAGEGFLRAASGNNQQSQTAMRDTTRWVVQLSAEALLEYSSVSETVSMFDTTDLTVLYGLGLPGQMLVGAGCTTTGDAIRFFESNPFFESYESDAVQFAAAIPNDPKFDQQHGLHNTGQSGGVVDADIDAPEAWDIETGSRDVVVAVIDSGVDYTHPELAANIWTNPGEVAGDGIDNDLNGFIDDVHGWDFRNDDADPMDDHRHGTHVAGIIGAVGNNGLGVTGVAQQTSIMALKFLDNRNTGYTSDAVRAINYATMMRSEHDINVRVLNNSYTGQRSTALEESLSASSQADILFVSASGNGNILGRGINLDNDPVYPASLTSANMIVVGASGQYDEMARFSNYGVETVDLVAPGIGIYGLAPTSMGSYQSLSGTSMAAPLVSGTAALLVSHLPDITTAEIKDAVLGSVDKIDALSSKLSTGGRLNTAAALNLDTYRPRVTLVGSSTVSETDTASYPVTVTLRDNNAINLDSIGTDDLKLFGSNGRPLNTTVVKDSVSGNEDHIKQVVYLVQAPEGGWDSTFNDTYTIQAVGGEIADSAGNSNLAVALGDFIVEIALAGPMDVTDTSDAVDANPGDGQSRTSDGKSTLRSAIMEANATAGLDTIQVPAGTFTLTLAGANEDNAATGDLDITESLILEGQGPGVTTVDANGLDRIFDVMGDAQLTLRNMTITGGASAQGGAIYARGDVILEDVVISGSSSSGSGGAVYAEKDLSLLRSSVTGNQAVDKGGAIYAAAATAVNITESLIAGNSSDSLGGGVFIVTGVMETVNATFSGNSATGGGAVYVSANAEALLTNVTVTANTATVSGGGLTNDNGIITLRNTIVAGNLSSTDADLKGAITSRGNNLIGIIDTSTGITDGTKNDQAGTKAAPLAAGLTALGSYGGPTLVHSLIPGSEAIDSANDFWAPETDQRGKARPLDGDGLGDVLPDIGAMEFKLHSEIHGVKYHDRNENGVQDEGEEGLAGWVMYLDANDSGQLDINEIHTTTLADNPATEVDEAGRYSFTGLLSGEHIVRGEMRDGWKQVHPEEAYRDYVVNPSIKISDAIHREGDEGTTGFTFPIELSWAIDTDVSFQYDIVDETTGADEIPVKSGTFTITAGTVETLLTVGVVADTTTERIKSFRVELSNASGGIIATPEATGYIIDDDATFVVNSLLDTVDANPGDGVALDAVGRTTLRAAIMEANALSGDQSIELPAGNYLLTIEGVNDHTGVTGDLDVTDTTGTLTILGAGVETTVIDANQLDRVIDVRPNANLELNQLTLTGGHTEDGGGALQSIDANVNILDTNFEHNTAGSGGAISVSGTSTLNLFNVVVSHNSANLNGGGIIVGNGTTANVNASKIEQNQALAWGGGIWSHGDIKITNSLISQNRSHDGAGMVVGGTSNITTSRFVENSAVNIGGAIFITRVDVLEEPYGDHVFANNFVMDNSADLRSGGIATSGNSVVRNNTIYNNISGALVAYDSERNDGGAVTVFDGNLQLRNNTIVKNRSVWSSGTGLQNLGGTVTVSNNIITENDGFFLHSYGIAGTIVSEGGNLFSEHVDGKNDLDYRVGEDLDIGGTNLIKQPVFTQAASGHLTPTANSNAIQNGLGFLSSDLDIRQSQRNSSLTGFSPPTTVINNLSPVNGQGGFIVQEILQFSRDGESNNSLAVLTRDYLEIYDHDGLVYDKVQEIGFNYGRDIAIVDVDQDGFLDIISADFGRDRLAWHQNNGETFSTYEVATSGDGHWAVAAGDIDNDGDVDLVSGSAYDNKLAWYENDGNQNFTEHVISVNHGSPRVTELVDFDNDGDLDIVLAGYPAQLTFENFTDPSGWSSLGSGVNGNDFGQSDTSHAGGVTGEAGGRFTRSGHTRYYADTTLTGLDLSIPIVASGKLDHTSANRPDFGRPMLLGHFDVDNVVDQGIRLGITFTNAGSTDNSLFWRADLGSVAAGTPIEISANSDLEWSYQWDPHGGTDLVGALTVNLNGTTQVIELTTAQRSSLAAHSLGGFGFLGVAKPDDNESGWYADLFIDDVTYTQQWNHGIYLFNNQGGVFNPELLASHKETQNLIVIDLNDDQLPDLFVSTGDGSSLSPISIFKNNGDGTVTEKKLSFLTDMVPGPEIAVADLNKDGLPDLMAQRTSRADVLYFLNVGDFAFQPGVSNQGNKHSKIFPITVNDSSSGILRYKRGDNWWDNRTYDVDLFTASSLIDIGSTSNNYTAESFRQPLVISPGETALANSGVTNESRTMSGFIYANIDGQPIISSQFYRDDSQFVLENARVFIDQNQNNVYDVNEPLSITDFTGYYEINDIPINATQNLWIVPPEYSSRPNAAVPTRTNYSDIYLSVDFTEPTDNLQFGDTPNVIPMSVETLDDQFLAITAVDAEQENIVFIYDVLTDRVLPNFEIIVDADAASAGSGLVLAKDGNTLLIGVPTDDESKLDSGAVYVYEKTDAGFELSKKLKAPIPQGGANFGHALAVDGNTMVVGSPYHDVEYEGQVRQDAGRMFIYRKSDSKWNHVLSQSELWGVDQENHYGYSVDLLGEQIVVGAPNFENDPTRDHGGAVFAYKLKNVDDFLSDWQRIKPIKYGNFVEKRLNDGFGHSVILTEQDLFISAPNYGNPDALHHNWYHDGSVIENKFTGVVMQYYRSPWEANKNRILGSNQVHSSETGPRIIHTSDASSGDEFGSSLSVSGDTLIVGAPKSDHNGVSSGASYIFRYHNGAWRETDTLLPADGKTGDQFGSDVAIAGHTAFIATDSSNGTVYSITGEELDYHPIYLEADDYVEHLNFGFMFEPSSITGNIYRDLDVDGIHDASEVGFEGWTVYIDADLDGVVSSSDPKTTTDSSGQYSFVDLEPYETYTINQLKPTGYVQTAPLAPAGISATLVRGHANSEDFQNLYDLTGTTEGDFYFIGRDHDGRGYNSAELFHYSTETGLTQTLTNTNQPEAVTTDGSTAFWIDSDRNGNPVILKREAGGETTTVVYPRTSEDNQLTHPVDIEFLQHANDKDEFLVLDAEEGQLWLLKAGGVVNELTKTGGPRYASGNSRHHDSSLVVDGDTVYVADPGMEGFGDTPSAIESIPLSGSEWITLYSGEKAALAQGITIGRDKVIFSSADNIYELAKNGGDPTLLVNDERFGSPAGLWFGSETLYAVDSLDLTQATSWEVSFNSATLATADKGWQVTPGAGENIAGLDFGNIDTASLGGASSNSNISGRIYQDSNTNSTFDAGDIGLTGKTVYIDLNNNNQFDDGEPAAVTLADDTETEDNEAGTYLFNGLAADNYQVTLIAEGNLKQTSPVGRKLQASEITVGDGPRTVIAADLNADGHPDLILTNGNDDNISVLLSDGKGGYTVEIKYTVGSSPSGIVALDYNQDGKLDLAVSNLYTGNLSLLAGVGDGSFAAATTIPTDLFPSSITAVDVNGDGREDLVVTSEYAGKVNIFTATSNGSFNTKVAYSAGESPQQATAIDFDSDGDVDLAVTDLMSDKVTLLTNDGAGVFTPVVSLNTGKGAYAITSGDINGDDRADLIVTNVLGDDISIFLANGSGGFLDAQSISVGKGPTAVELVDIDADNDLDIAVTSSNSKSVVILVNHGNGTFRAPEGYAVGNFSNSLPFGVTAADLDGNGFMELVVTNSDAHQLTIFDNRLGSVAHATVVDGEGVSLNNDFILSLYSPPTINSLVNLNVDENSGAYTVRLTGITAGIGEDQSLSLTANASNPTLIADLSLDYASPASLGKLSVTPAKDQQGSTLITVTVTDGGEDNDLSTSGDNKTASVSFNYTVVTFPWCNTQDISDVNNDGITTPLDAVNIINYLNVHDAEELPESREEGQPFYDVNKDGWISPVDAIQIINVLNQPLYSVSLIVTATDLQGNELVTVPKNQLFYLMLSAQDIRQDATGVYAAYADVYYDPTLVTIASTPIYLDPYLNGKNINTTTPGLLDEWGAVAGFDKTGGSSRPVSRILMRATKVGPLLFDVSGADDLTSHDVLAYNSEEPIPHNKINFEAVNLIITDSEGEQAEGEAYFTKPITSSTPDQAITLPTAVQQLLIDDALRTTAASSWTPRYEDDANEKENTWQDSLASVDAFFADDTTED